ncbi:MAG: hypothetical protein P9L93_06690 [Candidatus Gorgyraea atricola]|nr:hypothetical protein [Candidatus Gorgyraea atricola]
MIKRVIFLIESPFNLRDYKRFGIEILEKDGFYVEVWDLSPLLYSSFSKIYSPPDAFKYEKLTILDNKVEMCDKLSNLSHSDFVINFIAYNFKGLEIYRALSKSSADYAVCHINIIPISKISKSTISSKLLKVIKQLASIRYPSVWKRLFMKLPPRCIGVRAPKLILLGGNKCADNHYPADKHTENIQIHSLDYDLYLENKNNIFAEKPVAVFLDEFLPFHSDFILMGRPSPAKPEIYYKLLNDFFDIVEKETGLEVVIAAHPRSTYENFPDYFNGRKCIRGKTVELTRDCKLILTHCSTSLNFANLFYKSIIFITYSDIDSSYEGCQIKMTAKCYGKRPIFIDKDRQIDFQKEFLVNKNCYDNFRREHIKADNSEDLLFWQIVSNRLKKM